MKAIFALAILLASQSAHASYGLAIGTYFGPGINVTVGNNSVSVELGCSSGTFPRPIVDARGKFESQGTIETMMVMRDRKPNAAKYIGETEKNGKMRLWIEEGSSRQEYRLEKGPKQLMMHCR